MSTIDLTNSSSGTELPLNSPSRCASPSPGSHSEPPSRPASCTFCRISLGRVPPLTHSRCSVPGEDVNIMASASLSQASVSCPKARGSLIPARASAVRSTDASAGVYWSGGMMRDALVMYPKKDGSLRPRAWYASAIPARSRGAHASRGSCCPTADRCQKSISSRFLAAPKELAMAAMSRAENSLTVAGAVCAATVHWIVCAACDMRERRASCCGAMPSSTMLRQIMPMSWGLKEEAGKSRAHEQR
mmetsp:Transcript_24907/g.62862  ORF Transcript_24907/g.62862 Transcript_24907/m.62862 type:complete len:246 (-) Transcript_24907:60-797(-)